MEPNNKPQFIIIKTTRNRDKLLYNKFFYVKDASTECSQLWRCQNRSCKGRLKTSPLNEIQRIEERGYHNHTVSDNDINIAKLNDKIKKLAQSSHYSTSKVYSLATRDVNINNLPVAPKRSFYKIIREVRKRESIDVNMETNLYDLNITTLRGEKFVLHDSGSNDVNRIVIFATATSLNHLSNSKVWVSHGTFNVVSNEFYQLYVIHGKIFKKHFPLVYILMKNRSENMYMKVLSIHTDNGVHFPEYLIINFEIQSLNAFKKASKNTNIQFCLFHFGQCIWRRIQKEGLAKIYLENSDFNMFIKFILSLAFVPKNHVEDEFKKLENKAKAFKDIKLDSFLFYFEKNFLKSKKYPLETWNAYERVNQEVSLTSNVAEAFNCHFHKRFDQSLAGLQTFIEKLKDTQSNTEQDIKYIMCNPETNVSEKEYVLKMEKIRNICNNYEAYYEIYYLEAISTIYNWKIE